MLISIIGPMYNETELVFQFCNAVKKSLYNLHNTYDYEIILVNDGSTDDTYDKMLIAQENDPLFVTVVNLTRNFGLEGAVKAGLQVAKGDIVIVMDADLQDPPQLIPRMVKK